MKRGNRRKVFVTSFLFILLITPLLASAPAMANVSYNYIGNPFTNDSVNSSYLGSNITASVTFDNTVTNDFTGVVGSSDIVSYSISSGPITVTNTTSAPGNGPNFVFQNGVITAWGIQVRSEDVLYYFTSVFGEPGDASNGMDSISYNGNPVSWETSAQSRN